MCRTDVDFLSLKRFVDYLILRAKLKLNCDNLHAIQIVQKVFT